MKRGVGRENRVGARKEPKERRVIEKEGVERDERGESRTKGEQKSMERTERRGQEKQEKGKIKEKRDQLRGPDKTEKQEQALIKKKLT